MQEENKTSWKQELARIASMSVTEQRRARRWRIAMWLSVLLYVPFALVVFPILGSGRVDVAKGPHIGVVEVMGVITSDAEASAEYIVSGLREAIANEHTKAVLLRVNSPGGSPVQSALVYKEIMRLRDQYPNKPVYAVIEDLGASGAYYIASAAEKIYASESSIVGSIGVTSGGSFGFVDILQKLGVERRIYTSGENKAFLDPFLPEKPEDRVRYESMLNNVHEQFITAVEVGRKDKLKAEREQLYSGYVWTGEESLALGLIDGYGSVGSVARDVFEIEKIVDYSHRMDFFRRFANQIGAGFATTLSEILVPHLSFR